MHYNSCLTVDLGAVRQNAACVRTEIGPRARLIPVLKANAYGLGVLPVAHALAEIDGIDTFAVSCAAEGLELRNAGFHQQILVMGIIPPDQLAEAVRANLIPVLAGFWQFPIFRSLSKEIGRPIPVSLKLDTGLHRIGFEWPEADDLCARLAETGNSLTVFGTFSHFAGENPETFETQESLFLRYLDRLREAGIDPGLRHLSASASLEAGRGLELDAVRVGRRLFLDHPLNSTGKIREAFSLQTHVTDIRIRHAGETVGYGGAATLQKDTRVGVLSIGYGDGLDPALARAGAPVLIHGARARMLACCMDQSFAEIGDIPAVPGDRATLFGPDGDGNLLPSQEVAALIGCEGVDLTSRLTPRVERRYLL